MSVKPAYTHSILHINANEIAPQELMKLLCTEFGSTIGLVVREPDRIEVERFLELGDADARFELANKINVKTQKYSRQFTFLAAPQEFDEDECQPWVPIRDSKGNPLLTLSLEGDFPGRTSAEGFSEAYVLMNEYFGPKLNDIYKLSGNNPQKLFDYITGDSFAKDLVNLFGFRACFAFMPSMGEPMMLGNFREEGKGGATYKWGSCSWNLGYTEAPVEVPVAPAKEATMPKNPPKASKYLDDTPPIAPEDRPAKPSVPIVIPATPSDPIEKVAEKIVDDKAVKWAPPIGLKGKGLKKAYRDMLGHLPEDWQQRPSFMIKAKDAPPAVELPAAKPKDMKADGPKIVQPVIDGKQQAKAVDFIKKHLGDGSTVIDDPLAVQKQESNLAVFSELCLKSGNLDEVERWPVSSIFAFTKENPEVAALAIIEYRRDRINRKSMMQDGGKTLGELTGVKEVPTPPASEPLIPSKPEAIPPALPEPRRASGGSKYM